jgi:metal-dependent amidase/aminoacylase/carboxypeptidase family protein
MTSRVCHPAKWGFTQGFFRASVDALDVTIFGRGGHGARPQNTVDPIVIAARAVLGIQTIVPIRALDEPVDHASGIFIGETRFTWLEQLPADVAANRC